MCIRDSCSTQAFNPEAWRLTATAPDDRGDQDGATQCDPSRLAGRRYRQAQVEIDQQVAYPGKQMMQQLLQIT